MIAVDTNILVHAHQREASLHVSAKEAIRSLAESPAPWMVCCHCLVEFYGVVTQRRLWRIPSTPTQAIDQIAAWRASPSIRIHGDSDVVMDILAGLLLAAQIRGAQVHDARIAACCLASGVSELWTVDRDFSRFPDLSTRNPLL